MAFSIYDNPYYSAGKGISQGAAQGEGNTQSGGDTYGQIASGIGSFTEGAASAADSGRFNIDPNAGFTGSFKGLAKGGVIGAIAGGIGGQIGTNKKVLDNIKNLNTGVNTFSTTPDGQPLYNSGAAVEASNTISELNKGQSQVNKGIDPATRIFSGVMGTKKKLRRAENQMRQSLTGSQQRFNALNINYQRQQLARQQYEDQLRKNNVFNMPMGYF